MATVMTDGSWRPFATEIKGRVKNSGWIHDGAIPGELLCSRLMINIQPENENKRPEIRVKAQTHCYISFSTDVIGARW